MIKTATPVDTALDGWRGDARLYRLSEPVEYEIEYEIEDGTWYDTLETSYVVVSAKVVDDPLVALLDKLLDVPDWQIGGPETYIFPADPTGLPLDWTELKGSFKGGLDHDRALRGLGYEPEPVTEEVN